MSDSHVHAGFVAPEPADLAPLFPGYDIQSLIATGGMGAVYCAVQKSLDRAVALKILPMEFSNDAAFCAGFEAEAKAMARLNHPNLIGVYDFGEVNGMLFIIMEYVPGKSIYHSAYGRTIDPKEVIRLVTGVCNGLAHAHENGILHRDIKPSNILLDLNAEPKIGDFGLARPMERKIEVGEEIFGTPHYTAPEVVNSPHSVDYRADIFSVGVLLHELLTGKLPADDPRPASIIARCDVRFDAIIKKATQPLAAARYSSAKEIAADLQMITPSIVPKRAHGPVATAHRVSKPPRGQVRRAPKKSSGSPVIVFLLAAMIAAAAAYVFYTRNPPLDPTKPEVEIISSAPTHPDKRAPDPSPGDSKVGTVSDAGGDPIDTRTAIPDSEESDDATTAIDEPDATVEPGSEILLPKSDVLGFFERARKIMKDRAKPVTDAYDANMKFNYSGFEADFNERVRKYKSGKGPSDKALEKAEAAWKADGKVPDAFAGALEEKFPELETVRAEHHQEQIRIEDTLQQAISQLADTYIHGLELQIERLKPSNDVGAIDLIEKEIASTRDDLGYFSRTVLGISTDNGN